MGPRCIWIKEYFVYKYKTINYCSISIAALNTDCRLSQASGEGEGIATNYLNCEL